MKKEIKFWILAFIVTALALGTQLLGQDAYDTPEERDREIQRQEQRENQSSKVVKTLQDWDFRKYEAAHKRAHLKMDKKNPRKERVETLQSRQLVRNILVGGVAFYVGYLVGQDDVKKGKKMWKNKKDDWKKK
tara:strand:- start:74 stop:472 length:399 start_codon:yes stop_codon:yes gene_type:complete